MYTPLQLESIKRFGRKDLTEGCIILNFGEIIKLKEDYKIIQNNESERDIFLFGKMKNELSLNHKTEILGHIPELFPDVARVLEGTDIDIWMDTYKKELIASGDSIGHNIIPYNPTIPLIDQPNLEVIINLFK